MAQKQTIDAMWDDSPINVSTEVNFIWSIANKLRGTYQSDKYKDVIIPMVIIRRFECALEPTKDKVVAQFKANPNYPAKAMYRISGFQFYNTSEFTLAELINDADNLAANFKAYLQSFSPNVQEIIISAEKGLDFYKQIDKMDKNDRLLSIVKEFSELNLNPRTIDNVKMGYIFEDLIRRFSENAEAGDHYTGRDIIKLMVNILLAEGWLMTERSFRMQVKSLLRLPRQKQKLNLKNIVSFRTDYLCLTLISTCWNWKRMRRSSNIAIKFLACQGRVHGSWVISQGGDDGSSPKISNNSA